MAFFLVACSVHWALVGLPICALVAGADVPAAVAACAVLAAIVPCMTGLVVGRALLRLEPWSRNAAILTMLPVGLLFPFGTWVAYRTIAILRSAVGRTLFTPAHAWVRARSNDVPVALDSRLQLWLLLQLLVVAGAILGMLLR